MLAVRYNNRKLYSPKKGGYICLNELTDTDIENLYVQENKTKLDITKKTLRQLLAERITSKNIGLFDLNVEEILTLSKPILDRLKDYRPNTELVSSWNKGAWKDKFTKKCEMAGELGEAA